jgi:hypothetical protein
MSEPKQNNAQNLTIEHKIRLECLKITYRHDKTSDDAISKAKSLAIYVMDGASNDVNVGQDLPRSPADLDKI